MLGVVLAVIVAVGVPVGLWVVGGTLRASQGAASPAAASEAVLGSLGPYADDDLSTVERYLCPDVVAELRQRLQEMRGQLEATPDGDVRLDGSDFLTTTEGGTATVRVRVAARFSTVDASGQVILSRGEAHEWVFRAQQGSGLRKGWRICDFTAPALCGTYITC